MKSIKEQADELIEGHLNCFIIPSHETAVRAAILTANRMIDEHCIGEVNPPRLKEVYALLEELKNRLKQKL